MKRWGSLAVVACVVACMGVSADVIYSNFGSGDSYDGSIGRSVTGPAYSGNEYDPAVPFTPGVIPEGGYFLDSVIIALDHIQGSNQVDVIVTDDNGGLPGTILDQTTITAPTDPAVVTATFAGTTPLTSGQQYWVWLSGHDDEWTAWYYNNTSDSGLRALAVNLSTGGSWTSDTNTRTVFRVEGTPVPEPGAVVLLVLGAVGLVLYRRKRK